MGSSNAEIENKFEIKHKNSTDARLHLLTKNVLFF